MRIAAIGEIVEDVYLPDERSCLGGISANFARAARTAGAAADVHGAVGTDERGARLRRRLTAAGLSGTHVQVLPGKSAVQHVRLGLDGERIFCGFDPGVLAEYELDHAARAALCGAAGPEVLALTASPELAKLFASCMELPLAARQRRVADFSQDSALGPADAPETWVQPWLDGLAIAFVGGRAEFVPRLAPLTATTDALVVITAGAAGAWACAGGHVIHQPSVVPPGSVVDTTGCGDAFQGAFTVAWASGADLAQALRAGAERAAAIAMRV